MPGKRSVSSPRSPQRLCVALERTGGVAGIRLSATLDAQRLAPRQATQLRQWIEIADFFNLPRKIARPAPQPDRFQYKLSVTHGRRRHVIVVAEAGLSAALRPLVEKLLAMARKTA